MGESTAIAHAVFIIVSVMMASVLAFVVLSKLGYMQSVFSQAITEKTNALGIRIMIVNAYKSGGTIYIYAKNVGTIPYSDLSNIDLYVGDLDGALDYYKYSSSGGTGTFTIEEMGNSDGIWSPGETFKFTVNSIRTYGDLIRVKIVLSNGVTGDDVVAASGG
ncbi:MAG: flagellin [Desulfurococcales archaeon]|nr:flagellin [Desulfurococcales archaeon]